MAWKKVYQGEVKQVTKDTTGLVGKEALFSLGLDGMVGKHIRVTVEEEVSECCEKWRGSEIARVQWIGNPHEMLRSWPTFCPECGRKL